jgi:C1A family cysteine protease
MNIINFEMRIPFPCPGGNVAGGHAVVAVGYDDTIKINNAICGKETMGSLMIRNSWGTSWGEGGHPHPVVDGSFLP